MTTTCYALDAVEGAPEYSGQDFRVSRSAMLAGASSARPLGAWSGVRIGTPADTVSVDGTEWTVGAHSGVIDKHTATNAGPYLYAVTVAETGDVDPAHATYARKDIIWVRIDDPAQSDGSSVPAAVVGYTAGTASASPATPSTPANSIRLAVLNVPVSGGGSTSVTWSATYAAAAGGIIPVRSTAERATLATAFAPTTENPLVVWQADVARPLTSDDGANWKLMDGTFYWADAADRAAATGMSAGSRGVQEDTGTEWRYVSGAWVDQSVDAAISSLQSGVTTADAHAYKDAGWVSLEGQLNFSPQLGTSTTTHVATLPAGYWPAVAAAYSLVAQNDNRFGRVLVATNGQISVNVSPTGTVSLAYLSGIRFKVA
jgi:hypothetical protein